MTLPLIVWMFLVKIEFNLFLVEQCVESFFLLFRQHGRWRRRWCGQCISLPSSRNAFRTCMSNKEQQIFKIIHIFGRVLPIGHGIRRPMTHRKSRRRRLDNGSVSANEWRCHQFVSLECARVNQWWRRFRFLYVSVESFLREYNIDESQQNLPPRFLKMIRTCIQSTD